MQVKCYRSPPFLEQGVTKRLAALHQGSGSSTNKGWSNSTEIAVGRQDVGDAAVLVSRNRGEQLHHLDQAERIAPLDLGADLDEREGIGRWRAEEHSHHRRANHGLAGQLPRHLISSCSRASRCLDRRCHRPESQLVTGTRARRRQRRRLAAAVAANVNSRTLNFDRPHPARQRRSRGVRPALVCARAGALMQRR